MNSYGQSIRGYHHLHGEIRVEPVNREKTQKDEELQLPAGGFALLVLTYLSSSTLLESIRSTESLRTPQKVIDALKQFIAIFSELQDQDLSADWRYCEKLSKSWSDVVKSVENATFPSSSLNTLITEINEHPEKGDHTLGYYLSQHAGEQWIPFPFMEILRKLHEDKKKIPHFLKLAELALRSLL
ncbi:MAG: hypothetical protein ACOYL1_06905 [Chlamydiia bacterium]|jgi:hypothetical protein